MQLLLLAQGDSHRNSSPQCILSVLLGCIILSILKFAHSFAFRHEYDNIQYITIFQLDKINRLDWRWYVLHSSSTAISWGMLSSRRLHFEQTNFSQIWFVSSFVFKTLSLAGFNYLIHKIKIVSNLKKSICLIEKSQTNFSCILTYSCPHAQISKNPAYKISTNSFQSILS